MLRIILIQPNNPRVESLALYRMKTTPVPCSVWRSHLGQGDRSGFHVNREIVCADRFSGNRSEIVEEQEKFPHRRLRRRGMKGYGGLPRRIPRFGPMRSAQLESRGRPGSFGDPIGYVGGWNDDRIGRSSRTADREIRPATAAITGGPNNQNRPEFSRGK
ncbi:Hypothetical protein NTJ_03180 [Nesidiocoris tenuis]|uniref:Uncharacterized protein n=1 Tax=Nesidiocoris tenuis TaxID=355587 RepID=A0ABN7ADK2_9HEMI|nr:Hypothetical protein NTJ_03180 [Nesidiocoris tenuis]